MNFINYISYGRNNTIFKYIHIIFCFYSYCQFCKI